MTVGVLFGQVDKHVVVRREAGPAHLHATWGVFLQTSDMIDPLPYVKAMNPLFTLVAVVIGVTRHQSSAVKVRRKNEGLVPQPAHHSSHLQSQAATR